MLQTCTPPNLPSPDLPIDGKSTRETIQSLRNRLSRFQASLRTTDEDDDDRGLVCSGIKGLDELLPDRGLAAGSLSEWISAQPGSGAAGLAMRLAVQAQARGPVVIIDRLKQLYPPGLAAIGLNLSQTLFVHPATRADELWATEQTLRCPGISAVVCRFDRLRTPEFRRLQLAAESSTAIGLMLRPAEARRQSGWADVRLLVSQAPKAPLSTARPGAKAFKRQLEVRCIYAKGSVSDRAVMLDVCDETNTVCVASGLPHSASVPRNAGASA